MKLCKLFVFTFFPVILFAQNNLSGVVLDYDTRVPVTCATVVISGWESDNSVSEHIVKTDENGRFIFTNLATSKYWIEVTSEDYRIFLSDSYYDIQKQVSDLEILLYSYESESYKMIDVADQDVFDLSFAANLYSPSIIESDDIFKQNTSIQFYNINLRFKLANKLQMGFIYNPIELSWHSANKPATGYIKERYFGAYTSLSVHFRFIPTVIKKTGARGLFIDLGAGYKLPYYYAYSRFIDDYTKLTTRHIHRNNEFDVFARIGYSWGAVKINYRLTDILKGQHVEPPKLSLGVELFIPLSDK